MCNSFAHSVIYWRVFYRFQKAFFSLRVTIKAYNKALDSGLDPRGQKGEIWDGNGMGVNQVFDLYPSGRSSVPQSNTKGYVFYDWENDGIYDHMEFYSAGFGTATYVSLPELGGIQ